MFRRSFFDSRTRGGQGIKGVPGRGEDRGASRPSGSSPVASRRHIADTAPAAIKALPHSAVPHVGVKLPAPSQSVFAVHPRACPSRLPVPSPRPDCLPVPSPRPDCLLLRASYSQSVSEVYPGVVLTA